MDDETYQRLLIFAIGIVVGISLMLSMHNDYTSAPELCRAIGGRWDTGTYIELGSACVDPHNTDTIIFTQPREGALCFNDLRRMVQSELGVSKWTK